MVLPPDRTLVFGVEDAAKAMARMQPTMDAMQKHAAELQKQYSDPEKIKAMQAQAEAMRSEAPGLAELEHNPRNNRIRAR